MGVTTNALPLALPKRWPAPPLLVGGLAFLVCFGEPLALLVRDWWSDPDSGHGLLLFPVSVWLAWKRKLVAEPRPQEHVGLAMLVGAILLRYLSGLAAELFTMRMSMLGAVMGLLVYAYGFRQLVHWWLPLTLTVLSVPIPDVLLGALALPLQFKASAWGAAMLEARHVPVRLAGNVLYLPGRSLFVTEACSGLRSLTALLALGVLVGGLWLRSPWSRGILVLSSIPVAMVLNAVRVFLTGFLVYYVNPALADGFMHLSEGWVIFVIALAFLGGLTWLLGKLEHKLSRKAA